MALSENDIELIQKYLGEAISSNDKLVFESRLNDLEFKDELLLQSKMIDALAVQEHEQVVDYLQSDAEHGDTVAKRKIKWLPFLVGIAIGLLATFFVVNFLNSETKVKADSAPIALVEKYSQVYPAEVIGRGADIDNNLVLQNAFKAYSNGEYKTALTAFQSIAATDEQVKMYKANCNLQLGEYQKAKMDFEALINSNDKNLSENAEWYLSLCELGLNKLEAAKAIITRISQNSAHIFSKQAKNLLSDLNS